MQSSATLLNEETLDPPEFGPGDRIYRLREMYWNGTHDAAVVYKPLAGCGDDSLVGHARDFSLLLEGSEPFIQDDELIVGCCLATPEDKESLDLGYYDPHYPPGHDLILDKGLVGVRDIARERLSAEPDPGKRDFLRAVEISYDAACRYVTKYAHCARSMADAEQSAARRRELLDIAAVCDELTTAPPSTFHAALQLVQFVRVLGGRGCIGRFDQWLYPYYQRDVDAGRITPGEGQELLECLFIKLNYFPAANAAANDTLRNISLAGQEPDGSDGANELTRMCLRASSKLMLPEPKVNLRFFQGSPPWLLQECSRALASGSNVVAIYNDEVAIPALTRLGIPIEDARYYCNDGCEELIISGKSTINFRVFDSLPVLTETVMRAEEEPYATFGQVMADYKERLTRFMSVTLPAKPVTHPFFAASIHDCLEQASPSGARYNLRGVILAQVGNSADGLAALEKLIFQEGILRWEDLIAALKADYQGYEPLRQMLLNRSPKYGNDEDRVDAIAKEIAEYFCDGVHERANNPPGPGTKWAPGLMCFGIHRKSQLPASPDGRRQGDLTAMSFSPAPGMDKRGPTAVLNSAAKVDLTKASHGSVLDMALHSSVLGGRDALDKLGALVQSFLTMPCSATLQLNIIDRETLLEALQNPDAPEYKKLIVRVWGFSAVFVELPPGLQDHVLARTEHGMA